MQDFDPHEYNNPVPATPPEWADRKTNKWWNLLSCGHELATVSMIVDARCPHCKTIKTVIRRVPLEQPVPAPEPSPAVAPFSQPHSYFTKETGWTEAGIAEQERRAKMEPVPAAVPSPTVSDAPTKWTDGPWTYRPIPGNQFVIEILHTKEPLRLTACSVPPGRDAEVREVLTLAAAAPELYALMQRQAELLMTMKIALTLMRLDDQDPKNWGEWKHQAENIFQEAAELSAKARGEHA